MSVTIMEVNLLQHFSKFLGVFLKNLREDVGLDTVWSSESGGSLPLSSFSPLS